MSKQAMEVLAKMSREELSGHSGPQIAQTLAALAIAEAIQSVADALAAIDDRDRMRFKAGK